MLVRRKRSNKRKRKFYEAIEFTYSLDIEDIEEFLGDLGKVEVKERENKWMATSWTGRKRKKKE